MAYVYKKLRIQDLPPLEFTFTFPLNVKKVKDEILLKTLEHCGHNRSLAAEMLGQERTWLVMQIKGMRKRGIEVPNSPHDHYDNKAHWDEIQRKKSLVRYRE